MPKAFGKINLMDNNIPTKPEAIELAAAALRGETVTPVAKAAPIEEEDKEEKKEEDKKQDEKEEVAKALTPEQIAEVIRAAVAPVAAELNEVRKSLAILESNTQATMNFQSASTDILVSLKGEVEEQREVQKSVAATVEAVAKQPQGRRSAANDVYEVAKSAPVKIDLTPLREWAREQGFTVAERVAYVHNAEQGDYRGIPNNVQKAMGVQ